MVCQVHRTADMVVPCRAHTKVSQWRDIIMGVVQSLVKGG